MKPNILLVTADQWRGDCLSSVGHSVVKTPNLDALAAEGVLFRRHYAGAAPCSPARASIYTGLYQMNHRVCVNGTPLDRRFDTVALAARRAGYDPTLFGYTDVSPDPRSMHVNDPHLRSYEGVLPGFSVRQLLTEDEKQWLSWLRERGHSDVWDRSIHALKGEPISKAPTCYSEHETQTAFLVDAFLRWQEEQDDPWFAHLSFLRPHPPFCVPAPYNTMYSPAEAGLSSARAESRPEEASVHPFISYALDRPMLKSFVSGGEGRVADLTDADFRVIRSIYFGMISEVDAQFGRIVTALKAADVWKDTVVVFTSDHGEMMGDHWSLGKGGFHEGSYHIPLIIRDPNETQGGRRIDAFTSAADIMPTLCERMGIAPANHMDGRSLQPFMRGEENTAWRDHAFWEFDFRDIEGQCQENHFGLPSNLCNLSVIRDQDFKYVHFAGLDPLLFDMREDPFELVNLADDPNFLSIRLRYAEKLLSLRAMHLDQTLAFTVLTSGGAFTRVPDRDNPFAAADGAPHGVGI
ncbi:alkaline phosphatase family protein [Ciceribacter sp. L1K22]|uniref:alkaline phosphatase family protein n=1 Tax=Ciceribacter sp. L1K22 TaxID=2820275 RepID=UPI001ABE28F6|nr:alkaline phosphatase family protein [Ciceribacter sp. L1K22]MBO3758514.1 alkaline phosphatase family protein [Ciceribacter sp. L1K22]